MEPWVSVRVSAAIATRTRGSTASGAWLVAPGLGKWFGF